MFNAKHRAFAHFSCENTNTHIGQTHQFTSLNEQLYRSYIDTVPEIGGDLEEFREQGGTGELFGVSESIFRQKGRTSSGKFSPRKCGYKATPGPLPPPPVSGYGIHHSSEICNQTNLAMVWRFVNTKRFNDKNPKVLYLGSSSPTQDTQQADLFVELFSNNFSHSSIHQIFDQTSIKPERCQDLLLIEYYVFNELLKINTDKGTGPDGIHPLMLKHCAALM